MYVVNFCNVHEADIVTVEYHKLILIGFNFKFLINSVFTRYLHALSLLKSTFDTPYFEEQIRYKLSLTSME